MYIKKISKLTLTALLAVLSLPTFGASTVINGTTSGGQVVPVLVGSDGSLTTSGGGGGGGGTVTQSDQTQLKGTMYQGGTWSSVGVTGTFWQSVQPVSGTFWQATQPISGTVTANAGTNLNTSALATSAVQTNGTQKAQVTDGTTTASVISGDTGNNGLVVSSARKEVSFSTTTAQALASTDCSNYPWVSIQITSQGASSTATFQTCNDNSTWVSNPLFASGAANGISTAVSTSTTAGMFHGSVQGRYFRINVTGIASGTTAGVVEFRTIPGVANSLGVLASQSGTWTMQPGNTPNTTPWLFTSTAGVTGGYSFTNITTATTTAIKSGAGTLHNFTVNTAGASSTCTLYDNTTGSGTKIGTYDTSSIRSITLDIAFSTGLTAVTTSVTPADETYTWK